LEFSWGGYKYPYYTLEFCTSKWTSNFWLVNNWTSISFIGTAFKSNLHKYKKAQIWCEMCIGNCDLLTPLNKFYLVNSEAIYFQCSMLILKKQYGSLQSSWENLAWNFRTCKDMSNWVVQQL